MRGDNVSHSLAYLWDRDSSRFCRGSNNPFVSCLGAPHCRSLDAVGGKRTGQKVENGLESDPHRIRTDNRLVRTQIRYHCASEPFSD